MPHYARVQMTAFQLELTLRSVQFVRRREEDLLTPQEAEKDRTLKGLVLAERRLIEAVRRMDRTLDRARRQVPAPLTRRERL